MADFDSKVYTNVLASIYYNYKVYDGHITFSTTILPTGATALTPRLPGWNWKATQMQNFGQGDDNISYAPLTANKAVLIASRRDGQTTDIRQMYWLCIRC